MFDVKKDIVQAHFAINSTVSVVVHLCPTLDAVEVIFSEVAPNSTQYLHVLSTYTPSAATLEKLDICEN